MHPSQQQPNYRRKPQPRIAIMRNGETHSFTVRLWAVALILCGFVIFSTAYLSATAYLVYRDDLLGGTLSRQVAMQHDYEDRLSALRAELDRVSSRHAVATQGVGDQLATLLTRQAQIENRQADLGQLIGKAQASGIDVAQIAPAVPVQAGAARGRSDPAPLAYASTATAAGSAITDMLIREPHDGSGEQLGTEIRPLLSAVGSALDAAETEQSGLLDALGTATDSKVQKLSTALAPLGVSVQEDDAQGPQGGPFIAAPMHFVERAALLSRTLDDIAALRRSASALPLLPPVRSASISSRFGYRNDPFLGRQALHAGLDFAARAGSEVHATGSGTVVSAGWKGSYGQLVEIRHADGVRTRYGHLSAILVEPGASVEAGDLIGRVGSTGRSTGAHLHYETRRNGEPVNPALYLAAGKAL